MWVGKRYACQSIGSRFSNHEACMQHTHRLRQLRSRWNEWLAGRAEGNNLGQGGQPESAPPTPPAPSLQPTRTSRSRPLPQSTKQQCHNPSQPCLQQASRIVRGRKETKRCSSSLCCSPCSLHTALAICTGSDTEVAPALSSWCWQYDIAPALSALMSVTHTPALPQISSVLLASHR